MYENILLFHDSINNEFEKLNVLIDSMNEKELNTPFDFSKDEKKKEAHWKRDKNVRYVLIHLYEWHKLVLNWISSNMNNIKKQFLPSPYNLRNYGDMNIEFWKKQQDTSFEDTYNMLKKSHKDIMKLIEDYSNDELFAKDIYSWVGGSILGSYFVSSTSSL